MAQIVFEHVTKEFVDGKRGKVIAVNDASFTIEDKEFVVLVGPSGCGKTTTLRLVAGLEMQTKGNIFIDDKLVNDMHPKDRNIAMVFQDYALYPHMTVYENMSFGLRNLKQPMDEIDRKVKEAARMLGISELLDRLPRELSGGQRQRVALGRTIVRQPKVFLMDEPLSNLDAKLRMQMRVELAQLHKRLEATIIYVTHDQVEAMTLGQRIVVMDDGLIQQIAPPEELYEKPSNLFVAQFIGSQTMNVIEVDCDGDSVITPEFAVAIPSYLKPKINRYKGKKLILGIRAEDIYLKEEASHLDPQNSVTTQIRVVEYLGAQKMVYFDIQGRICTAQAPTSLSTPEGASQTFIFDMSKAHLFDPETGKAIR